jgi:3-hydroxyacyl-[acyl-carrier-protein] dehydratase
MSAVDPSGAKDAAARRSDIERLIPHRDPFLWIDEIVEAGEQRLVARKHVPHDLDVFRGHYPAFPVLPGVLLCEAIFQAGAALIARLAPPQGGEVPVVTRIQGAQFRRMVRPGETLTIEVELTERLANAWFLKGKASVEGQTAARVEFACAAAAQPAGE